LTAIIILIVLAILIYKKKYLQSSKQVMMNVIDNEIRPGNFMEKIKTINMDNPYIINNNNHINNNCPLFNFNMSNIINTNNLNSYDYENHFKNGIIYMYFFFFFFFKILSMYYKKKKIINIILFFFLYCNLF